MSPTHISHDDITDQAIHSGQLSMSASADDSYLRSLFKQYCFFIAHRTTSSLFLGLKQDTCTWRWFIHKATLSTQFWNTTEPITLRVEHIYSIFNWRAILVTKLKLLLIFIFKKNMKPDLMLKKKPSKTCFSVLSVLILIFWYLFLIFPKV